VRHFNRWGAIYILVAMFAGSWFGQFWFQLEEVRADAKTHGERFLWADFWPQFWAATFENWQSEFLQLAFQALLIASVLLGPRLFAADRSAEQSDLDRVEGKVDEVLRRLGDD
jgi:hypothetical protein